MHANTAIPNTDCSKGTEEGVEQVLNYQHQEYTQNSPVYRDKRKQTAIKLKFSLP